MKIDKRVFRLVKIRKQIGSILDKIVENPFERYPNNFEKLIESDNNLTNELFADYEMKMADMIIAVEGNC